MKKFGRYESDVPPEHEIDVFKIGKTGERDFYTDEYDIISEQLLKFPINRIKWIWIREV